MSIAVLAGYCVVTCEAECVDAVLSQDKVEGHMEKACSPPLNEIKMRIL